MKLLAFLVLTAELLGAQAQTTLPAAIQNPFRFGPPGNVLAAGFDGAGNLYIAGVADGTFGGTIIGPGGAGDLYIMKVSVPPSASVSHVAYLTGIGGTGSEQFGGMVVDPAGNVFLAGTTRSQDFPTTQGSFQPVSATGGGFLLKLDPTGQKLVYSTYFDQNGTRLNALTIDSNGNAYVGGATSNGAFPTTPGAYQRSIGFLPNTEFVYTAGFVTEFNARGSALVVSTLLGGDTFNGLAGVTSIAIDATGVINVGGNLGGASNFPVTSNAPYTLPQSLYAGFLARLSPSASELLYSTPLPYATTALGLDDGGDSYLLGSGLVKIDASGAFGYFAADALGSSLVVLGDGTAIVAGGTEAPNFPTRNSLLPCVPNMPQPGTTFPTENLYIGTLTTFDSSGNITFSTLLGGPGFSRIDTITFGPGGALYPVGATLTSFPGGPVIDSSSGTEFVIELDLSAVPQGLPAPSCLVNGASDAFAPATAGTITTLYGSNLGPSKGLQFQLDANGLVATELGGTSVTVGGVAAPILYSQDTQVNFVVPQQVSGSTTNVCVTRSGVQSCIFAFTAQEWAAVFCVYVSCDTLHQGFTIINQDGTWNTPYNPAGRGSVVQIFGTGMGPYDRTLADRTIVGPPLANLTSPVQATFYGPLACISPDFNPACNAPSFPGTVLFAGAAPMEVVGVTQINVQIPENVIPGSMVALTLQSAIFSTGVNLSIK
jgi:uncharacterized protein (TIGR03437 family)